MARTVNFHIGHPKCMSKYFQSILENLDIDKRIYYSGFRPSKKKFFSNKIESNFFDLDLRYSTKFNFDKNLPKYKKYFNQKKFFNKDFWLSAENVSLRFIPNDHLFDEKINRINQVFIKDNINYHLFFRNIYDLIKSIYYEYRYQGYSESFNFFCDYILLDSKSNFIEDLSPAFKIYQLEKYKKSNDKYFIHFFDNNNRKNNLSFNNIFNFKYKKIKTANANNSKKKKFNKLKNFYLGVENSGLQEIHRTFINETKNKLIYLKLKRHKNRQQVKFENIELKSDLKKLNKIVSHIKFFDNKFLKKIKYKFQISQKYWSQP